MRFWLTVLIAAMASVASQPAMATASVFKSGDQLLDDCGDVGALCQGYVMGIADGLRASQIKPFCIPAGIEARELAVISVAWLMRNPLRRSAPARIFVKEALSREYPCSTPK